MADSDRYSSYSDDDSVHDPETAGRVRPELPPLPPNNPIPALLAGLLGGLLATGISVAITLANTSAFQQVAQLGPKISYETASYILGLSCLSYLISLAIAFGAGLWVAKRVTRRMHGFYAGALVGAVAYVGSVLIQYIPNYPGRQTSAPVDPTSIPVAGLLVLLATMLVWALLGGLMGLWGARTATKTHPYYVTKQQILDEEW